MCAPLALPVVAAERLWRHDRGGLDPAAAHDQWLALRAHVDAELGDVVELTAEPWARAQTFVRDLAVATPERLIALDPDGRRYAFERPLFARHLARCDVPLSIPDIAVRIDGGNVLADHHGRLLVGVTSVVDDQIRHQTAELGRLSGRAVLHVPVVGERFPHLDMALCDLNGKGWLAYPPALPWFDATHPAWQRLFAGAPVTILDDSDGEALGCNLVVGPDVVIGPMISPALRRSIEATGHRYIATPLDELAKAGGGAHCLTLEVPPSINRE